MSKSYWRVCVIVSLYSAYSNWEGMLTGQCSELLDKVMKRKRERGGEDFDIIVYFILYFRVVRILATITCWMCIRKEPVTLQHNK